MLQDAPTLHVSLARSDSDLRAAQRLRYEVFIAELGGDGPDVDHDARLERDRFDAFADHLLLHDPLQSEGPTGGVVGVYRLLRRTQAEQAGGFYSDREFDLSTLTNSPRRVLELGRSCLHPDYRGGAALMALWKGLANYVTSHEIDVLFGVASFHGTDVVTLSNAISHLHHAYLARPENRVVSRTPDAVAILPENEVDRKAAMRDTPALIKSYLKIGGKIGQGAFVDHAFNTTDVCLILDTDALPGGAGSFAARPRP
ncbi:GNAT family N-acetyltransferase [Marivita hallyeonensis]|uniref:L-ornithine N(alpha)-acyltransferase n=1 Tax=Marivita hallyeonensis TaxID=996342 RepID=A0A1M5QNK3_9RHOB|nr:GNAT family N-acyltransferase [Marivita hallyeonensis]SHH15399.1 ornithine-acyl[acyl carrier protein] N-acyltransferase [Marivita hallyeonensis]